MTINRTFNFSTSTARLCSKTPLQFGSQADLDAFKQRNLKLELPADQTAILENLIADDYGPMHTDTAKMEEMTSYTTDVIKFLASNFTDPAIRIAIFVQPFMQIHDRVLGLLRTLQEKQAQLTDEESRKLVSCLVRTSMLIEKVWKNLAPAAPETQAAAVTAVDDPTASGSQPEPANQNTPVASANAA